MYGLEVVQCRGAINRPLYCAFPYRLMGKIVHYSEMSKTRKSPRKSFPEHWEPSQKRAGTVFPNKWGKSCTAACPFFGDTSEAVLYRPIGAYSVLPQTGNGSRWHIQPSEFRTFVLIPSAPFCAVMHHAYGFPHTTHAKAAQSGVCAVTEAFTEHGRAWNTSPTPTFAPRFRCQNTLPSANMVNNSVLLSGANPEKAHFSS